MGNYCFRMEEENTSGDCHENKLHGTVKIAFLLLPLNAN